MGCKKRLGEIMCCACLAAVQATGAIHSAAIGTDVLLLPSEATRTAGVNLTERSVLELNKPSGVSEWEFELTEPGAYSIFYEIGCINWASTSKLEFSIDGTACSTNVVPNTDNAQEIFLLENMPVKLTKGKHTLKLATLWQKNNMLAGRISNIRITKATQISEMVDSSFYEKKATFAQTLQSLRNAHPELADANVLETVYKKLWADFPHQMSWMTQDAVPAKEGQNNPKLIHSAAISEYFFANRNADFEKGLIQRVLIELTAAEKAPFVAQLKKCANAPASDARWLNLYEQAARVRRTSRLKPLLDKTEQVVFAKHQVFGWKSGIYNITETEGLHPKETSSLCTIDLTAEKDAAFAPVTTLFDAQGGIVRDPDLAYDADRILFAWRKTDADMATKPAPAPDTGNYQVYEMDLATRAVRQLTTDETYGANYEAVYMPNGEILFNSARIVQHITCGWGDHSNLFLMDKDGKYQRRVGFDQVSTQFPAVLNNGQVLYLRRDYNDRGQAAAHALFVMNPDGTGQTEYYGNQTDTPNSFMHARGIPGSEKVVCILSGYHTRQGGQLAVMDIRKGRNHAEGIIQIPQGTQPPTSNRPDDGYLKGQIQYANPYALSETEFIVSRSDDWCASPGGNGYGEHYAIYFMTADNRRELLAYDADNSCLQPVPVLARKKPSIRPSMADYTQDTGTFYVQNVYLGAASKGITNAVKKIRVVEVLYKHDTINSGRAHGPGGGTDTVTPPAHPLALFDAKKIIGEATVYEDGSALFEVPARTPVYFQLLDEKNRCLQTMRSWSTLMPSERFSCVGCHEDKNETPVTSGRTMAMAQGIEKLTPFYGPARGFSFMKEVQPVFDAHCVSCHKPNGRAKKLVLTAEPFEEARGMGRRFAQSYTQLMAARPGPDPSTFSVFNGPKPWRRKGKAMADEPNQYVQYWGRLRTMEFPPPYFAGAIASGMIQKLEKGHAKVKLPQEDWDKLVAWIDLNCPYSGDYMEANLWGTGNVKRYENRIKERQRNEAIDAKSIKEYIEAGQP